MSLIEVVKHWITNSNFPSSGPGCSSMGGGAFTELGPFFPSGDGRGLRRNSKSWNKGVLHRTFWSVYIILIFVYLICIFLNFFAASNLLFVESPAGVGWSYSNTTSDYTCGDASTGKENSSNLILHLCLLITLWLRKKKSSTLNYQKPSVLWFDPSLICCFWRSKGHACIHDEMAWKISSI